MAAATAAAVEVGGATTGGLLRASAREEVWGFGAVEVERLEVEEDAVEEEAGMEEGLLAVVVVVEEMEEEEEDLESPFCFCWWL